MKHKLLAAICLAVVAVFVGVSAHLHADYINSRNLSSAAEHKAQMRVKAETAERSAKYDAWVSRLQKQCVADHSYFNGLTSAEKAKVSAPTCIPNLIQ